jgi:hypothetical protein
MEHNTFIINMLTAMITPAILILACGSLSLTTSQRLSRSINRKRSLASALLEIKRGERVATVEEQSVLHRQMIMAAKRAVILQWSMSLLYTAMSLFIATSLLIGLFTLMEWGKMWVISLLSMTGVAVLFSSSIILIVETRLALASVTDEMEYILSVNPEQSRTENKGNGMDR